MFRKNTFGSRTDRPSSFRGGRSQGGRPSYGGSRGGYRKGGNRSFGQRIDVSKFINKAVITEQVEHFIPEHSFMDFAIDQKLKVNILAKGYQAPTPIQDRSIPHILRGSDIVGVANTGTGKTAAFLIPLINKILLNRSESVLIVVPTRELAIQIEDELKGFAALLQINSVVVVGGAPIGRQISQLRRHNHFIIGTPGRLEDLIERRALDLSKCGTVVLDEADRMLDMGFINPIRNMLKKMRAERHTLFFTATFSKEIEGLTKEFLKEPVMIRVQSSQTPSSIDQDVVRIQGGDKLNVLHDLLIQPEFSKVLIFGKTKHGVEKLSKTLLQKGFKVESIHGNKNLSKRQRALGLFKDSHIQVLIATDVAARGLDISDVSHVINYDIPATYDDYIHRIGRTGRGGKKGKALTFID
jgi:superfamily II DNA/RNA helicase